MIEPEPELNYCPECKQHQLVSIDLENEIKTCMVCQTRWPLLEHETNSN